jgi:hypothetical protein
MSNRGFVRLKKSFTSRCKLNVTLLSPERAGRSTKSVVEILKSADGQVGL